MQIFGPARQQNPTNNFNMHMLVTGLFVAISYMLTLLPLCLFGIAQTLAIYGKKRTFLLSFIVVLSLCAFAFTGFAPVVLGAVLAVVSIPFFLIVSILRQKRTSIFWSAAVLLAPILIFFGTIVSAPSLNQEQYESEITKIENTLTIAQSKSQTNTQNSQMYSKALEQMELIKRDPTLRSFMGYNINERLVYFIYGNGFSVLLGILLSFFASLFFLDFAFEQVEKLKAVKRYVRSLSAGAFDVAFLLLLKNLSFKGETDETPLQNPEVKSLGSVANEPKDSDF